MRGCSCCVPHATPRRARWLTGAVLCAGAQIQAAAQLWSKEGTLLFTSSSAVYGDEQDVLYTEVRATPQCDQVVPYNLTCAKQCYSRLGVC